MNPQTESELIQLYAEMSALTSPECASVCLVPHSCCSAEYCEQAIELARSQWGVKLKRVNGKGGRGEVLPLMGKNGCTALPHFRPTCTIHTCAINGIGFKKGDANWTERYFNLRNRIEELELEALVEDLS
jgi:hypothetical protein